MHFQQHEASVQPLSPQTNTTCETELEKLLLFYRNLPVRERATYFSGTTDIAKKYGVQPRTVQRWIDKGLILAVRIGKKYIVYLPSLDEYLRRCLWRRME